MIIDSLLDVRIKKSQPVSRRHFLRLAGTSIAGTGFLGQLSLHAEQLKKEGRACVLVWLAGGPSQMETWDPKPGSPNSGKTKAIRTATPGMQLAQYWPKIARLSRDISVIRSMTNKEGAHARATYHLHTGHRPTGALKFPNFGSVVAAELGDPQAELPNFVSIGQTVSSGFLGVRSAPFVVSRPGQLPQNVAKDVPNTRLRRRLALLSEQDDDFRAAGATALVKEHQSLYTQASRMMTSKKLKAFQLDGESQSTRNAYGNSAFGQGMLVARRLIETGVPFVEVRRGGWDNHRDLNKVMPRNAGDVDGGLSQLVADLKDRGMLDRTLVVCMGEFGRTPKMNKRGGRDHWPKNFNLLMAGGGIRGGRVVGKTDRNGQEVIDRPLSVEDLFQTMCRAMKIDSSTELFTPIGRPLTLVDGGQVIHELFS